MASSSKCQDGFSAAGSSSREGSGGPGKSLADSASNRSTTVTTDLSLMKTQKRKWQQDEESKPSGLNVGNNEGAKKGRDDVGDQIDQKAAAFVRKGPSKTTNTEMMPVASTSKSALLSQGGEYKNSVSGLQTAKKITLPKDKTTRKRKKQKSSQSHPSECGVETGEDPEESACAKKKAEEQIGQKAATDQNKEAKSMKEMMAMASTSKEGLVTKGSHPESGSISAQQTVTKTSKLISPKDQTRTKQKSSESGSGTKKVSGGKPYQGDKTKERVPKGTSTRKILPLINKEEKMVVGKEGVHTDVFFVKERQEFQPVDPRVPVDKHFLPGHESLGVYGPKTAEEHLAYPDEEIHHYAWAHIRDVHPKAILMSPEAGEEEFLQLAKMSQQGCFPDCWFANAQSLMARFHHERLKWLIVQGECSSDFDHNAVRLRIYNEWVVCYTDFFYALRAYVKDIDNPILSKEAMKKLRGMVRKLLGMQNVHKDFLLPVFEKFLAILHGSFKRLRGGFVFEGLSYLCECLGIEFNPYEIGRVKVTQLLYEALYFDAEMCRHFRKLVALNSNDAPTESVLLKNHAYGLIRCHPAQFDGKEVLLVSLRDSHGRPLKSPIDPKAAYFKLFDSKTQKDVKDDLKEVGVIILTAEMVCANFTGLEIMMMLPPTPSGLTNDPLASYEWLGLTFHMQKFEKNFKDKKEPLTTFPVPDVDSLVGFVLTLPGARLGKEISGYLGLKLTVRNQATGEKLGPVRDIYLNRYQVATYFWAKKITCTVKAEVNIHSISDYCIDAYCIENYPHDPKMPPEFGNMEGLDKLNVKIEEAKSKKPAAPSQKKKTKRRSAAASSEPSTSKGPSTSRQIHNEEEEELEKVLPCWGAHQRLLNNLAVRHHMVEDN